MAESCRSLNQQIAEVEENLRLIAERKAEFPEQQLIPLDLIKNEHRLQEQLADLQARRARVREISCPYRGLQYFDLEHAADYFGREAMVQKLLARLQETNFVVVVGPSGSGKSSLVRAGLRPALCNGALPGSAGWEVDILRPGEDPLRALAASLADRLAHDLSPVDRLAETRKLADHLAAQTLPMADVLAQLRQAQPTVPRLLLIVDQFEEVFTLCTDEKRRQAFFDALLNAIEVPWLTVILTLRADFYGRLLADERLSQRVDPGLVNIMPMTVDERHAAIEQPAMRTGRRFEEGLVQRILDAIADAPGDLPLLEFALTELWAQQTADGVLTHTAYDAIGEVQGAIAKRADDTLTGLSPEQQGMVQGIFTRLVQVARPDEAAEDTRRRIDLVELAPETQELVPRLADARLLVTGRDAVSGEETIEVAHEALIRGWRQLQEWLNRDREFLLWRQRLRTLAAIWQDSERTEGALLRDALLREAQVRAEGRTSDLNALELAYIRESELAAERIAHEQELARHRELKQAQALAEAQSRRAFNLRLALAIAVLAVVIISGLLYLTLMAGQRALISAGESLQAKQTAEASAEMAQKQLAQLEGERLLTEARDLKEKCDVPGAIAKFAAAAQATPTLKLDLRAEEADLRRQCATKWVQKGEQLAAAGDVQKAIAKFQEALDLAPPADTPVYVRIPTGEFTMGADAADALADEDEKPQHTLREEEFWIMRTEVTNAQYRRCVEAGICDPPDNQRYDKPQFARQPVIDVGWERANTYARWVGGRLPNEAEWEKACRGTDARIYPWGNLEPTSEMLNFGGSGMNTATDVGSYPAGASPYGALDMAGNVWEWTSSLRSPYPYKADDGREDPTSSAGRVLRGGAYGNVAKYARCTYRFGFDPVGRLGDIGFRVVVSPIIHDSEG